MRVTLGYRWGDHQPDETIDVPAAVARRLLHEGKARIPTDDDEARTAPDTPVEEVPNFRYMLLDELKAYAEAHGITIPPDVKKRPDIAELLAQARTRDPEPAPDPGNTDPEEAPDGR